tara:strand:- start:660 stop:1070 length:411 start_codon:yes stop_codon:yes gene_type:complete
MFDFIFQGGIDERFTDWDEARNFVIFTIDENPRFDNQTKTKLQDVEQDAYNTHANQFFQSEKEEIARYYTYLKNQFPSITNDDRFLAIFDAASEVKADQSSVGFDDIKITDNVKDTQRKFLIGLGLFGVLALVLRR